jgi:hypothetical protein
MVLRREIELLIQNEKLIKFVASEKRSEGESRRSPQRRIMSPPRKTSPENRHDRKERRGRSRGPRRSGGEHNQRGEESMNNENQPSNQLVVREIHTISGGLAGGGESTSVRKAHARSIPHGRSIPNSSASQDAKEGRRNNIFL